ncbi:MAG TPA: hypothetical protein VJ731_03655 [Terriglobales bacterium]|nr:hypothetical protein [Terriglobales bacterium]
MKVFFLKSLVITVSLLATVSLLTPVAASDKTPAPKIVDSGSFGVFSGAHRVATEVFSIKQSPLGSVVSSEFKSEEGEHTADQTSQLELTPSVGLRRYEWKETSPEKMNVVVEPNDTFLVEHIFMGQNAKPHDQNFLLPSSTSILDDYFFIQREVLAWKYLSTGCKQQPNGVGCPQNEKVQLGTLNPHARTSMPVSIEFTGKDKVTIRGTERELSRFVLKSEAGDWAFWLDDELKLVRLLGDNGIEVVRD